MIITPWDLHHNADLGHVNITAEIKTGQRRMFKFLLSPVQRVCSEGLRER
ncbi:MAG: hypothetical protein KBF98_02070 [Rhodoferax sp.]|jgi:hypothetical protein|nr:hypothetical protein [Rhodoferax sp.]MBP9059082.1 hypothetical protein [Rhodoferax sp.]MBP9685110.1 hypothetical protein [Rhodoferax sp.]